MSIWDDITGVFTAPTDAVSSVSDFFKLAAWMINPLNWLRIVEFLTGMFFVGFGLYALMQSTGRSRGGAGPDMGKVVRSIAMASPAGRTIRTRQGRKMGKREGQRESARMEARRHATRGERTRSAAERERINRAARKSASGGSKPRTSSGSRRGTH